VIIIFGQSHMLHAAPSHELEIFHRYSSLDNNLPDWSDWRLLWAQQQSSGDRLYTELNDIDHFDIHDQNLSLGYQHKISSSWQLHTELSASSAQELFPAYSLYAGVETKLSPALILNSSLKLSQFDKFDPLTLLSNRAESLLFSGRLELYSGNHLYGYSLYYTQMQGPLLTDSVLGHSVKYSYIYNDRNNISFSYALGGEIDFDKTATLSRSDIESVSLGGMHWLNPTLAVVYTLASHTVISAYQRNELYLGLRKLY